MLNVRHYMELFGISILQKFPKTEMTNYCFPLLEDTKATNQLTSSLIIITAYPLIFAGKESQLTKDFSSLVLAAVVPWLSSTDGLIRTIAQYMFYHLLQYTLNMSQSNRIAVIIEEIIEKYKSSKDIHDHLLYGTYHPHFKYSFRLITENPKLDKMRKRQDTFYKDFDPESQCKRQSNDLGTLEALLACEEKLGDFFPIPLTKLV